METMEGRMEKVIMDLADLGSIKGRAEVMTSLYKGGGGAFQDCDG